ARRTCDSSTWSSESATITIGEVIGIRDPAHDANCPPSPMFSAPGIWPAPKSGAARTSRITYPSAARLRTSAEDSADGLGNPFKAGAPARLISASFEKYAGEIGRAHV